MDLRLELVTVPVSDVDPAKTFYVDKVGFTVEQDVPVDEHHRFVELIPPGSLDRPDNGLHNFGTWVPPGIATERGRHR